MLKEERKKSICDKIEKKKVMVFSKSYCPYCKQAKSILKQYGINPTTDGEEADVMELDKEADGQDIQEYLATLLKQRKVTVPQIFIGGKCIGGCSDLETLHRSGKLKTMLS